MAGQLEGLGLLRAREGEDADVVCPEHVRGAGEGGGEGLQRARRPRPRRKREHPEMVIGVTGCVAQVSGRRDPGARAVRRLRPRHGPGRERRRDRGADPPRPPPRHGPRPAEGLAGLPVPPDLPRLPLPGLRHRHRGLRPVLHVLHRAVHPGPGAQPAVLRDPRRDPVARPQRVHGGHAARTDGQRLPDPRKGSAWESCCAASPASRGSGAGCASSRPIPLRRRRPDRSARVSGRTSRPTCTCRPSRAPTASSTG